MGTNRKTAIVLGGTGLTGSLLLQVLLNDDRYEKVKLFSRTSIGFIHSKLEEHVIDVLKLSNYADEFSGNEVFCCIGTTKVKTPSKELYKKIDHGIPVMAAELAKTNGVQTFIVISALGSNSKSAVFYNRVKGKMEEEVIGAQIKKTYILCPSLIGGQRNEKRMGERLFKIVMKAFNPFLIGPFEKYRSIHPSTIAKAMVWLANNEYGEIRIESDTIKKIAKRET